jgi:DNA-binding cell septation regulator SpoVG
MDVNFYEPKFKDGKILAFADVDVANGVIIKGFRVIRGERGVFAAVPSRPVVVEGQRRYFNQVSFSSTEIKERFLSRLLAEYGKWKESRSGAEETVPSHAPANELVE